MDRLFARCCQSVGSDVARDLWPFVRIGGGNESVDMKREQHDRGRYAMVGAGVPVDVEKSVVVAKRSEELERAWMRAHRD